MPVHCWSTDHPPRFVGGRSPADRGTFFSGRQSAVYGQQRFHRHHAAGRRACPTFAGPLPAHPHRVPATGSGRRPPARRRDPDPSYTTTGSRWTATPCGPAIRSRRRAGHLSVSTGSRRDRRLPFPSGRAMSVPSRVSHARMAGWRCPNRVKGVPAGETVTVQRWERPVSPVERTDRVSRD